MNKQRSNSDINKTEMDDNVSAKALRMRRYRDKLKKLRKEKYDEIRKKDAERKRNDRQIDAKKRQSDPRETEKQRKKWRENKRRQRVKKSGGSVDNIQNKSNKQNKLPKSTPTNSMNKTMKENESLKKKRNVLKVQNWRMRIKLRNYSNTSSTEQDITISEQENEPPFMSRSTEYRAVSKAKASLPTTPRRKTRVIEKLIDSPMTRKHLEKRGTILPKKARRKLKLSETVLNNIKKKIQDVKLCRGGTPQAKKTAYNNVLQCVLDKSITKYHNFGSGIAAYLKVKKPLEKGHETNEKWWQPKPRKTRKDKLSEETVQKVQSFYLSLDVSREVPNKKDVKLVDGEKVQCHIMTMTLGEAYSLFKRRFPSVKISLSVFKKLKPTQVKKVSETSHKSCLCQTCCNLSLKLQALNKHAEKMQNNERIKMQLKGLTKEKLANITVCQYETKYPKNDCLSRNCDMCSPKKIREYLDIRVEDQIEWYHWELIQVKKDDNSTKRVTSCLQKQTTAEVFLTDLEKDLEKYPSHIFRAKWQHEHLQNSINNLTEKQVIMLLDYSENYRCRFQNESQNAYFEQCQVTVHPFMLYYLEEDPQNTETENNSDRQNLLVKHPVIAFSNDVKHDSFAVKEFEKSVMEVLKKENKEVTEVIKFSDGAASQYKGKNSFANLSTEQMNVTHNFFETSHGKSPCDGLGAVVKNACFNAVKCGKTVISDAYAAYKFCKETLQHDAKVVGKGNDRYISKRHIVYVGTDDIKREETGVKTVKGTRTLHSARNTGTPFTIEVRNLSCFCKSCCEHDQECENRQYVDAWTTVHMKYEETTAEQKQKDPVVAKARVHGDGVCVPTNSISKKAKSNRTRGKKSPELPMEKDDKDDSVQIVNKSYDTADVETGDFVVVELKSRRSKKSFVAEVLEVDDDELQLSFMKTEQNGTYRWPNVQDVSWESRSCIKNKLTKPQLSMHSTNDRQCFVFN